MHRRALLTTLALAVLPLLFACEGERKDPDNLTFVDMLEALGETGKVFYAEFELSDEGDGQRPSYQIWYSAEKEVARYNYFSDPGQLRSTAIITPGREVHFDWTDNHLSDDPIPQASVKPAIPVAAGPFRAYFGPPNGPDGAHGVVTTESNEGVQRVDGRDLIHLIARMEAIEDGRERPKGTKFSFDVFFDSTTHFPVRSEMRVSYPNQTDGLGALVVTFTRTEFLDSATLDTDHFDPDRLANEEVTIDEAIDIAAQADFPIFWLGREVEIDWADPQGRNHTSAKLSQVSAPGLPGPSEPGSASLGYSMEPEFGGPMLSVLESIGTELHPRFAEEVAAMRSAGNVQAIPDADGFVYAQYASRGACSFAQAQADPACRMFADAVYGAVITINGTTIHLSTIRVQVGREGTPNSNPFSNPDVLLRLVKELRPIGQ